MMRKSLGFFAAGGLASLAMLSGAQAKMVRYKINTPSPRSWARQPSARRRMRKPASSRLWSVPANAGHLVAELLGQLSWSQLGKGLIPLPSPDHLEVAYHHEPCPNPTSQSNGSSQPSSRPTWRDTHASWARTK